MRAIRRRRASVTLLFCFVFLPTAFLAGAIAIDYGRAVAIKHRAGQVADAAALAAVVQFAPTCPDKKDNRCISETKARAMVQTVIQRAQASGAANGMANPKPTVTFDNNGEDVGGSIPKGTTPSVVVRIDYDIEGLFFFGLATLPWSATGKPTTIKASTVRDAYVCDPDVSKQSCVRLR